MKKTSAEKDPSKHKDWIVKRSKIHGKGVFATRDFKKGEVVIEWDLKSQVKKEDIPDLPEPIRKNVYYYKGKYIIPTSPGKYLNHSCDANTFAKNARDIALRDIKKGEEITINFSDEAIVDLKMKCRCGSKKCRNKIKSKPAKA
jgi:hypothetical protein